MFNKPLALLKPTNASTLGRHSRLIKGKTKEVKESESVLVPSSLTQIIKRKETSRQQSEELKKLKFASLLSVLQQSFIHSPRQREQSFELTNDNNEKFKFLFAPDKVDKVRQDTTNRIATLEQKADAAWMRQSEMTSVLNTPKMLHSDITVKRR